MVSVDLGVVINALKDLRNHPNIMIKDEVDDPLETRLEFYHNDNLIMAGSISYFRRIITNPTNPDDNEPKLGLGDRFTLDDFPEAGVSTKVRVIKIRTLSAQSNGQPDTIQYYIEPYSE